MTMWVAVLAVGAGSYAIRLGAVMSASRHELAPAWEPVVRHARTAALAALATLSIVQHSVNAGTAALAGSLPAVVTAFVLARRRRAPAAAMLAGIAVSAVGAGALAGTGV
jgi:branched-subunit amino acid transport protein